MPPVTPCAKEFLAKRDDFVPGHSGRHSRRLRDDARGLFPQAFFPRIRAWDGLKRALEGEYDDSVWDLE